MPADLLQLCSLPPALQKTLDARFAVHRYDTATDPEAVLTRHAGAIRGVVTGGHLGIPADLAARLPALEIVAINGVGYDKVDLAEMKRRGIRVSNTPDVLTDDVADLAVGLVIAVLRQIARGDAVVRAGAWPTTDLGLGSKVTGRKYGIFGFGRIGQAIAKRLEGFDATVGYVNRSTLDVPQQRFDTVADLALWSDVLIIAASASAETVNIVDADVLDALGPEGVLVNIARGSLVDEPALLDALEDGRIAGAALDVFADEPNVPARFYPLQNVVLTPHMASATSDTRQAMADLVLANLEAHFAGRDLLTAVV